MDFLREAWGNLAEEEKGQEHDSKLNIGDPHFTSIYKKIEKIAEKDKLAKTLFINIQKSALRYLYTIDQLSLDRLKKYDKEEVQRSDEARRRAHNALIDDLNIFSRYCIKNNLDNSWRNMVGIKREDVTEWVLGIAPILGEKKKGGETE